MRSSPAPQQVLASHSPYLSFDADKRAKLNAQIDAAAKTTKARGKKRKKNADEDVRWTASFPHLGCDADIVVPIGSGPGC